MKIYKKKGFILFNNFAYSAKLMEYEEVEDRIRIYFAGRKLAAFKSSDLVGEDNESLTVQDLKKLGLSEYEAQTDPIQIEADKYAQRVADGKTLSNNLMAELRLNSKVNSLPRAVNKYIEEKLERVKTNIDRGWWVTALEELESTTVESYFTQDLYDRIHLTLTEYIAENYD